MPKLTLQCSCQVSASRYTTPGSGNSLPLQARIFGENVLAVKGLYLSIVFDSNYSFIHPSLHLSFHLFIVSLILTMLSVMDTKINPRHVPVNWTGSWILVSSNIWPWLSRPEFQVFFSPPFWFGVTKHKDCCWISSEGNCLYSKFSSLPTWQPNVRDLNLGSSFLNFKGLL